MMRRFFLISGSQVGALAEYQTRFFEMDVCLKESSRKRLAVRAEHYLNGGTIVRAAVTGLRPDNDGWLLVTSNGTFRTRNAVVAARRWSHHLLRPLVYKVPLASERGYQLMLPAPQISLARPVVMAEPSFAATPMTDGLRLAGAAEFAATNASPDQRRSDILFKLAEPYLPGLSNTGATRWMGAQPSFLDALPAIGRASRHDNLFYSFGHQHVGLTQAAMP
jgi:D-amino-acid dehydrogenase